MMVNMRCWSCGKPISHLWEQYVESVKNGEDRKKVFDDLGLTRYCCRASLLGHVDLVDTAARFKKF